MKIDDLLGLEQFKELDLFLTQEMHRLAGDDLVERMTNVLENEENARDWFYSPIKSLDDKRPYDYCKDGKISEVENVLNRIEHGVYS
tara:strand:+ start:15700 stop:15960 length:261 start_codon:yes stop_codon:yes gene_type:complete